MNLDKNSSQISNVNFSSEEAKENFLTSLESQGFIDTVKFCTNASMTTAVEEIKSLPEYLSNGGEVMIIHCYDNYVM